MTRGPAKTRPNGKRKSPRTSMVEEAAEAIRNKILDLTLAPGTTIGSKSLVEQLGLGRTPIREALNRLVAEGLIQIEANQSVRVHPLDIGEVNQVMEALRVAERISGFYCDFEDKGLLEEVGELQAKQRLAVAEHRYLEASYWNVAFRIRIAQTCRNHHLLQFYRRTINLSRRLSCIVYAMEARDPDHYARQVKMLGKIHADLHDALAARDREQLMHVLEDHARIFKSRIAWAVQRMDAPPLPLD